ncbi:MAG TPA: response regulator transcription factor [Gammaproteobacteria bacterium]|nr:response regulator transcription factor [Gammaproteobacteria bacterium]
MRKILLIDDDEKLAQPLQQYFARFDLSLYNETHPLSAIERIQHEAFDLLILDVMLPEIDGFETCKRIRRHSDIPIIMLTARGEVMDRVVGLELGADDYLPKPFDPRELVARVQNILRRNQSAQAVIYRWSDLQLDIEAKQLRRNDEVVPLTAAEFSLLSLLAQNQHRILSRDEIMRELRGIDADIFSRAIDVLVSRLRSKLQQPELIRTVRGLGYQLVPR